MLMAMCMLAACSMVVSAEVETEAPAVENYLDFTNPYTNKWTTLDAASQNKETPPSGATGANGYCIGGAGSYNGNKITSTAHLLTQFSTREDLPVQKYIFSVWYKTNLPNYAVVNFRYQGANTYMDEVQKIDGVDSVIGKKTFTATLPATGINYADATWEQFVMIWDATQDVEIIDGTAKIVDSTGTAKQDFKGCFVSIGKFAGEADFYTTPTGKNGFMAFCDPVLAPMTEDYSNIFKTTSIVPYSAKGDGAGSYTLNAGTDKEETHYYNANDLDPNKGDGLGDPSCYYNFLGLVDHSAVAGNTVNFKFEALDDDSAPTVNPSQVLLATYSENQLTGIEIVDATVADGVVSCTIPSDLSGEVKAFFWNSNGGLKPLVAPVNFTIASAE